ncbi:hypothetical protein ACFLU6_15240, partial [Acidobacteriota bacterium]
VLLHSTVSIASASENELLILENSALASLSKLDKEIERLIVKREELRQLADSIKTAMADDSGRQSVLAEFENRARKLAERKEAEAQEIAAEAGRVRLKINALRKKAQTITGFHLIAIPVILAALFLWLYVESASWAEHGHILRIIAFGVLGIALLYPLRWFSRLMGVRKNIGRSSRKLKTIHHRLADETNAVSGAYSDFLKMCRDLTVNACCLEVVDEIRGEAEHLARRLEGFKKEMFAHSAGKPRISVYEAPWDISLLSPDYGEYVGRRYGAILDGRISELISEEGLWSRFKAYEQTGTIEAWKAEIDAICHEVFATEREEIALCDRLLERLEDESFRRFFSSLLSNLGVSASVNEETACGSRVRKQNFIAIKAPESALKKIKNAVKQHSGLEATEIMSEDPNSLTFFMHWTNWTPFQLQQAMQAWEYWHGLSGKGEKNRFSAFPVKVQRRLPEIFPVKEILTREELEFRELALWSIAMGWVEADWERREFRTSKNFEHDLPPVLANSYPDFIRYLASADGQAAAAWIRARLGEFIFERESYPEWESTRERCLEKIESMSKEFDARSVVFYVLESDDYEILLGLPEKLI